MFPQIITPAVFPRRDRHYAPAVTGFVAEDVHWAEPPEPTRYGDFWNVGKDTRHAWPHRYLFMTDNSASTLGVMALPGTYNYPTIVAAQIVRQRAGSPHQAQNPVKESVSIKTPKATSWGASRELSPLIGASARYAKLM